MSRGADHDVVAMRGAAAPPRRNGELVFEAPWQGRAFGLGVALCERGCYPWIDFQARLIDAIAANGSGEYYERWLEVLGRLLVEKGLVSEAELELRTRDFVSGARDRGGRCRLIRLTETELLNPTGNAVRRIRRQRPPPMRRYHELTKHTVERLRSEPHFLDWENQPLPFKIYTGIAGETLPLDPKPSTVSALAAVAAPSDPRRAASLLDRRALARLLHFSLGVVHRRRLADGRSIYFRAAPCTGALYHVDAYVACGDLHDVSAGLYHFGPHDGSLRRLRSGDWRGELVDASGDEPHVAQAPVIIVLASTYWRNAWKYRSRAWRHVFWDSGTILAQLLAQAAADGWSARLVTGFADAIVEKVCGLDGTREGAVVLVPVGGGTPAGESPPLEAIRLPTETLSRTEVEYPMIADAHAQSGLADGETAHRWRAHATAVSATEVVGELHPLPPPALDGGDPLETVILRRGSTRTFVRKPVSSAALATMLALASAPLAADYRRDPAVPLVDLFLIVHAVEGVPPGAYRWHPRLWSLERIAAGDFRREAGFLGLGQELAADAAVNVYAIADLDRVLGALGNRGYRAATLDGAVSGGRLYLAAYAQRLGATGLTFFDDEVARFFGLDPGRFAVTFLTAAGVGARL